ncbi:hypothetical protein SDC9_83609 [bioreactor metagenome]|uniref:Uncharacterized protein n=1 Tax=bioreactor metagenome TaxID=1076179 RepID=A0A644Z7Z9_9ZZZZ|nr:hypothetical protein [Oscillospiraceae bacterium]
MSITNGLQKFNRGNETFYVLGENLYTGQELEVMDTERQQKDEQKGYEDRKTHCYDKWYRYNRSDNGAAYDRGVVKCVNEAEKFSKKWQQEDEDNFFIIEIAECNRKGA